MKKQGMVNKKLIKDKKKQKPSRRKNSLKKNVIVVKNSNSQTSGKLKKNSKIVTSKSVAPKKAKTRINKNSNSEDSFRLTDTQKRLYEEYEKEFNEKSIAQLKEILTLNSQIRSGSKADLVERCAYGKLLGALPSCTKCGGGKLKFIIKTGKYFCPGYMDDTVLIRCSFKANFKDVIRNPWIEI